MLEINDQNKFQTVIENALAKVENNSRWTNAIKKAAAQIEANGEFMTYDETDQSLLIWSQGSNEIYSSNGVCQCKAFEQGFPCYHRAAARLIKNYMESPEDNPAIDFGGYVESPEMPPYLKQATGKKPERVGNYRI